MAERVWVVPLETLPPSAQVTVFGIPRGLGQSKFLWSVSYENHWKDFSLIVKCSDLFPGSIHQGTVVVELWSGVISKNNCLQILSDFLHHDWVWNVCMLLLLNLFLHNRKRLRITLPILKNSLSSKWIRYWQQKQGLSIARSINYYINNYII